MKTLPRVSLMAYHKKQNVYLFISAESTLLSFCVGPFVLARGSSSHHQIIFSVCAVQLTFDMRVIFQMFEESVQRT